MNNEIICAIDMFSNRQQVFVSPKESVFVDINELATAIPALCYSHKTYKVHLYGNGSYIAGLMENIKEVNLNYSNQNIEIEVN